MKLRLSTSLDIPTIMNIIGDAQKYLATQGVDQWQDGYPNEAQIKLDIDNGDSYVVLNNADEIMATTVFTTKKESTYQAIEGGWLTADNVKYGVIHRLAVGNNYRKLGIAKFVFNACEDRLRELNIKSMRIDTHKENKGMQGLIKNMGYLYCGIIYVESGNERLAFEKTNLIFNQRPN